MSPCEVFRKELELIGSFAQTPCFGRAIDFIENGIISVEPLITASFRLGQWQQAMDVVAAGGNKCIKATIKF